MPKSPPHSPTSSIVAADPAFAHKPRINYWRLASWFVTQGARNYRWRLVVVILLTVLASLSEGISLWLIVPILQSVMIPSDESVSGVGNASNFAVAIERLNLWLAEYLGTGEDSDLLFVTLLTLLVLAVSAKTALNLIKIKVSANCQCGLMASWSKQALAKFLNEDYLQFLKNKHGEMLAIVTMESRQAALSLRDGIEFLSQLILSIIYIGVLLLTSSVIGLTQLAILSCVAFAIWWLSHHMVAGISREAQLSKRMLDAGVSESLLAFRQIKASSLEKNAAISMGVLTDHMAGLMNRQRTYRAMPKPVGEFLVMSLLAGTVYYLYSSSPNGISEQLPALTLLVVVANRLFLSLARLATYYMNFVGFLPSMDMLAGALKDSADNFRGEFLQSADTKQSIRFKDITFKYPDKAHYVFNKLNLTIPSGKLTVVTGESGAGKSTFIDVLLGFVKPESGVVKIGDISNEKIDFGDLRRHISYVSQDIFMFNASIRDNMLTYAPTATDEEIRRACTKAQIATYISSLPDAYDTIIGDRGLLLSGGERQRLAIAIAFLRDTDLIVFDEATSALDAQTEQAIHIAVRELAEKTVIFVCHNFSPGLNPDQVIELRNGTAVVQ